MRDRKLIYLDNFKDYCLSKKNKQSKPTKHLRIKESNELSINVPFWNNAIDTMMGEFHSIAGEPVNYDYLTEHIKNKFVILGRDIDKSPEEQLLTHIKDLLYQYYGDTYIYGDTDWTYKSTEVGTKTLVINQLADEILRKVMVEAGKEPAPEDDKVVPQPKASLSLDYCEDDIYERKVAGFDQYTKMINESVLKIRCEHDEKCLDYCLNQIEKECEGLHLNDIMNVVRKQKCATLNDYIQKIVEEYLGSCAIELNGDKIKDSQAHKLALKQVKGLFASRIAQEVIAVILKENDKNEKVK